MHIFIVSLTKFAPIGTTNAKAKTAIVHAQLRSHIAYTRSEEKTTYYLGGLEGERREYTDGPAIWVYLTKVRAIRIINADLQL